MCATEKLLHPAHYERLLSGVQALSQAHNILEVIAVVREVALTITEADGVTFVLREGDSCYYAEENAIGPLWKGRRFPITECISGWCMLNRQSVSIEDVFADSRIPQDAYRETFVRSLMMVPVCREMPLAAIGAYWSIQHEATTSEITLFQALADSTAIAFANAHLYEELSVAKRVAEEQLEHVDRLYRESQTEMRERRRAEDRFYLAVEAAPNAVVMVDDKGRIVLVNAQTERLFGYSRVELLGRSVDMLVPERFRDAHPAYREQYYAEPKTRAMGDGRDLYGLRKDGTEFPVEIGLNPLKTHEGLFVLSAIVDITERKLAQESLKHSLREKELLLKEVHHRVKNNLQVISSLLKLQYKMLKDKHARSILQVSEERVLAMALVHEKLYRSKALNRVNFKAYVEELTLNLLRSYAIAPHHISLSLDIGEVELDIDKAIPCGMLLNELLSNCLKHAFSGRSTGVITISLSMTNEMTQLTVSDNGCGLPAEIDLTNPQSLGLQIVTTLSAQLGATLAVGREMGTSISIRFATEVLGDQHSENRGANGPTESANLRG